jgi:hypothetical protein
MGRISILPLKFLSESRNRGFETVLVTRFFALLETASGSTRNLDNNSRHKVFGPISIAISVINTQRTNSRDSICKFYLCPVYIPSADHHRHVGLQACSDTIPSFTRTRLTMSYQYQFGLNTNPHPWSTDCMAWYNAKVAWTFAAASMISVSGRLNSKV